MFRTSQDVQAYMEARLPLKAQVLVFKVNSDLVIISLEPKTNFICHTRLPLPGGTIDSISDTKDIDFMINQIRNRYNV